MLPERALFPLQSPDATHEEAFVEDHSKINLSPLFIDETFALKLTEFIGEALSPPLLLLSLPLPQLAKAKRIIKVATSLIFIIKMYAITD